MSGEGNVTFKRLQITPEGTYLLALDPDWPERMIKVPPNTHICGVVIGSWMRRC
jgi:SOS-response transcriptional repressor LexA